MNKKLLVLLVCLTKPLCGAAAVNIRLYASKLSPGGDRQILSVAIEQEDLEAGLAEPVSLSEQDENPCPQVGDDKAAGHNAQPVDATCAASDEIKVIVVKNDASLELRHPRTEAVGKQYLHQQPTISMPRVSQARRIREITARKMVDACVATFRKDPLRNKETIINCASYCVEVGLGEPDFSLLAYFLRCGEDVQACFLAEPFIGDRSNMLFLFVKEFVAENLHCLKILQVLAEFPLLQATGIW